MYIKDKLTVYFVWSWLCSFLLVRVYPLQWNFEYLLVLSKTSMSSSHKDLSPFLFQLSMLHLPLLPQLSMQHMPLLPQLRMQPMPLQLVRELREIARQGYKLAEHTLCIYYAHGQLGGLEPSLAAEYVREFLLSNQPVTYKDDFTYSNAITRSMRYLEFTVEMPFFFLCMIMICLKREKGYRLNG